jgi:hypothetical protein
MVVAAQDLAPQTPTASGVVLGLTTGVAGALYVARSRPARPVAKTTANAR